MKSLDLIQRIIRGHSAVIGTVQFETKHWGVGLPPELNEHIANFLENNPNAQWAKDNSIDNVYVKDIGDNEFISEEKTYELMVDLEDKEYMFWRLKNGS